MKFIKQISKRSWCHLLLSNIRFSTVCNEPFQCVNESRIPYENSLNTDQKSIYYFEDGLRKVYPFYFEYRTFSKERWINQKIIDVYCRELSNNFREDVERRISSGEIKINDKKVSSDYVLKNADIISSNAHRHDLAVLACPIEVLFENEDLLVVDKPPSLPVHPCRGYHYNNVLTILDKEYNKPNLYVVHRLDRLTSGVLLFAKSRNKSSEIHKELDMRNIKKEYVCRVEGNFPEGTVICDKPIKQVCYKVGTCIVHSAGKAAMTEFKKLSYNGKSSVVLCKPFTGRTHQIRVHLQFLGHPIINDPVYNSFAFGQHKGRNGITDKSVDELINDLLKEFSSEWDEIKDPSVESNSIENKKKFLKFSIFKEYYLVDRKLLTYDKDPFKIILDENCYYCKRPEQDPVQPSLGLFLHAYKYEIEKWAFKSDMPFWAYEYWDIA